MGISSASKFAFKRREELDALIAGFEKNLSSRLSALSDYCNGYANSILSVTAAEDDQYVCDRINSVLREQTLLLDALPSDET